MTAEETEIKWAQLIALSDGIQGRETSFSMRVRYNPHHPPEHRKEESEKFMKEQVELFMRLKSDYVQSREFLIKKLDEDPLNKKHELMEQLDKIITDDLEKIMLA